MPRLEAILASLSFRDAVLLFPLAVALHVYDEWPGFPHWARRFASPRYSDRAYAITHALAIGLALGTALLLRAFPAPWLAFAFFAFVCGPGVLCNAIFHAGACLASRTYCPGVVTGLVVYLPLFGLLATLAFHTLEVGHNVFERW